MVKAGMLMLIVLSTWCLARADNLPAASALKQERPLAMQDALANILVARRNEPAGEAARAPAGDQAGAPLTRPAGPGIVNLLAGLALCCGVFFVMLYVLKRCDRARVGFGSRSMKVVERLPLSSKTALLIVEVEGRKQLLGLGTENITFLGSLGRPLNRKVFVAQSAAGTQCESRPAMMAANK